MPTSRKQTCFIYHPEFFGPRNHGYSHRPVCPVPESREEEIVIWSEEKRSYFHWYPNGSVSQFEMDGTETFWPPRPSLQTAIFKAETPIFFHFRSNGDIHIVDNGEPFFFSGIEDQVEAEKGCVIQNSPESDDDWSDKWSEDSFDGRRGRDCGCCR